MSDLVSIIMPSYNVERYIEESISSVLKQTYTHWELLITDDASSDDTVQIIEKFSQKDNRIKLFRLKKNSGAAKARNKSIENASGRFIAFLDADDLWDADKLSIQIDFMLKKNIDISYTSFKLIDENSSDLNISIIALPKINYHKLLKNNYIGNLTGIYDCKKLGKIYQTNLLKRQDWCLWLEALKKSNKDALGIDQTLAFYRSRKNSISNNKLKLIRYNFLVYHQFLGFGFLKSIIYFVRFLYEYFMVRPKYISKN